MIVKTWKGGTYGVRISKADVPKFKDWEWVRVFINGDPFKFQLTKTFRTTCPELRGTPITDYLRVNNRLSWPKRKPWKLRLMPIRDREFRLSLE